MANGVQHVTTFVIHIAAAFVVYTILPYYWLIVLYSFASAIIVFICRFFAIIIIYKQSFAVVGKTLMHPHVCDIFCRNAVGKPLMSALVYNNKIPFHAPAGTRDRKSVV